MGRLEPVSKSSQSVCITFRCSVLQIKSPLDIFKETSNMIENQFHLCWTPKTSIPLVGWGGRGRKGRPNKRQHPPTTSPPPSNKGFQFIRSQSTYIIKYMYFEGGCLEKTLDQACYDITIAAQHAFKGLMIH